MGHLTGTTAPSVSGVSQSDSHSSMTAPSWAAVLETRGAGSTSAEGSSATSDLNKGQRFNNYNSKLLPPLVHDKNLQFFFVDGLLPLAFGLFFFRKDI